MTLLPPPNTITLSSPTLDGPSVKSSNRKPRHRSCYRTYSCLPYRLSGSQQGRFVVIGSATTVSIPVPDAYTAKPGRTRRLTVLVRSPIVGEKRNMIYAFASSPHAPHIFRKLHPQHRGIGDPVDEMKRNSVPSRMRRGGIISSITISEVLTV